MDKYVHLTDLSKKPLDGAITINYRAGGTLSSAYSKPLDKFKIGTIGINFFLDSLPVDCLAVQKNDYLNISGDVTNTHLLTTWSLECKIDDTTYPIEVTSSHRWSFNVSSRDLYLRSIDEIVLILHGTDEKGNSFTTDNSLPVRVSSNCLKIVCSDDIDTVSFIYKRNETFKPTFKVTIDGVTQSIEGLDNLKSFCRSKDIDIKVLADDTVLQQ